MRLIVIFFVFSLLSFGCRKREFKKYIGSYYCKKIEVNLHHTSPSEYIIEDSILVHVKRDGNTVNILNEKINIDDIEPEKEYTSGASSNNISVYLGNDSLSFIKTTITNDTTKMTSYFGKKE